ncbi:hypothetical protein PG996_005822 [Apiospora saccharicola]|uniref:Uncharacterized protein n=1 Tax=Apiospora saccharicola TaxID=335842 RepID=A0ABR1VMJ0_9PEZI
MSSCRKEVLPTRFPKSGLKFSSRLRATLERFTAHSAAPSALAATTLPALSHRRLLSSSTTAQPSTQCAVAAIKHDAWTLRSCTSLSAAAPVLAAPGSPVGTSPTGDSTSSAGLGWSTTDQQQGALA